jgi:hypothetical protein
VYDVAGSRSRTDRPLDQAQSGGQFLAGPISWSPDGSRVAIATSRGSIQLLTLTSDSITAWDIPPAQTGGRVSGAFFTVQDDSPVLLTLESCCASTPIWRLMLRTLSDTSAGPGREAVEVPEPADVHVDMRGEVTVTARDGRVLTGKFPRLRVLPGHYAAADHVSDRS